MDKHNNENSPKIPDIKDKKPTHLPYFSILEGSSPNQDFISILYLTSVMLLVAEMDEFQDLDMESKRSRKQKEHVIELSLDRE
jgi:hypothetical protein